jgi:hypothetical protein
VKIEFRSTVSPNARPALEQLMYFNPHQHKVAAGIAKSVEEFGPPQIVETDKGLTFEIAPYLVQSLFAFDLDRNPDEPIGLAIFSRTSPTEITVLHVAAHPTYTMQSIRGGLGIAVAVLAQVRRIGRSIAGVKRIRSIYRR